MKTNQSSFENNSTGFNKGYLVFFIEFVVKQRMYDKFGKSYISE